MYWIRKILGVSIGIALLSGVSVAAVAHPTVTAFSGRHVVVRPSVVVRPYGFYRPFGFGYAPGWYHPYGYAYTIRPATGEVKLDTHLKDASVYVDGGYVGPIGKFKKFSLRPGNHDIEVRDSGGSIFERKVQVIADKSVELRLPS
jgi:hypothetical protein